MECRVISKRELFDWIDAENLWGRDPAIMGTLLSGDRITCCDEVVAGFVDGRIVGVCTIAPEGEEGSGQPTIVAFYTHPDHRKRGYGRQIVEATVRRCLERGFQKIRVDTLSTYAKRICEQLPQELKAALDVHDLGSSMDMWL